MTLYQGLLYAHVVAAIVWVGGGSMLHLVAYARACAGPKGCSRSPPTWRWIGQRVLTPAALVVLACGDRHGRRRLEPP